MSTPRVNTPASNMIRTSTGNWVLACEIAGISVVDIKVYVGRKDDAPPMVVVCDTPEAARAEADLLTEQYAAWEAWQARLQADASKHRSRR